MTRYAAVLSFVLLTVGCSSQPEAVFLDGESSGTQVPLSAPDVTDSIISSETTALKPTLDWSQPNDDAVAQTQPAQIGVKPTVDLSDLNDIPSKPRESSGFAKFPASRAPALQVASARDTRPTPRSVPRPKLSPNLPTKIELLEASASDLRKVIDAYDGKVVFVDFWATWCGPCVSMFPHTIKMHNLAYQHDLRVITVSLDDHFKKKNVLKFLKHFNATSVNLLAKNEGFQPLSFDFGIPDGAIPHFRVYDRQGNKRYQWSGAGPDIVKDISGRVLELLREK